MTTGKDAQNSISFSPLDRADAAKMSDALYDILYNNMNAIAPTGNSYEEDKQHWVPCILSALENPRRQILLIWCGTELIGYFMYSLSETTFEMEEIQFVPQWQQLSLPWSVSRFTRLLFDKRARNTDSMSLRSGRFSFAVFERQFQLHTFSVKSVPAV